MSAAGAGARAGAHGKKRWTAVLVVALVVFAAALAALAAIWAGYVQGQQKYSALAEHVEAAGDGEGARVDWEALRAINPDVVAWLSIPGTNIDYPVVHGRDNDYYLTHDFDGDEGWLVDYGAIFMDWRNDPDWDDEAYFFYGHHMRDGSMFAGIAAMADQERFDASRTVHLLSPTEDFTLRTFSLVHCAADDPLVQIDFASPEELAAYVQDKANRSVVSVGDMPAADGISKVFAFATCDDGSGGRYVLYAYAEKESAA